MNRSLLLLLFCFLFTISWGGDTLVQFQQSQIKLPAGFTEFSSEQLTVFRATIFDRQIMTVYEKRGKASELQRIIIYYDSLTGTKNLSFDKIVEIKLEVIKESGIDFSDVKIDKQNRCAYGRIVMQGDTSIFGFSVDGFGMMGIQFDNSLGIDHSDEKKFAQLIKSIEHLSPYEYIPEESPEAKKAKEEMEDSGMLMTIAFVAVILVWLIRKYVVEKE